MSFILNDIPCGSCDDVILKITGLGQGGSGPFKMEYDGWIRTAAATLTIEDSGYSDYVFDSNHDYVLCEGPDESIDGKMSILLEDGVCVSTQNPIVNLDGYESSGINFVNLPDNILTPIDQWWTGGNDLVFMSEVSLFDNANYTSFCSSTPPVPSLGDPPIFGKLPDGTWLIFDPRVVTRTNTPSSPIIDGGKNDFEISGGETLCSNIARTFLNENECKISVGACRSSKSNKEIDIMMDNSTIATLNTLTGRYVYGIKGLLVNYDGIVLDHPCTPGLRSRWEPHDLQDCAFTDLYNYTNSSLFELLSTSRDPNPYIRDIYFPDSGSDLVCDTRDTEPEIEIEVDGVCWKRVHDEHLSLFDVSMPHFVQTFLYFL